MLKGRTLSAAHPSPHSSFSTTYGEEAPPTSSTPEAVRGSEGCIARSVLALSMSSPAKNMASTTALVHESLHTCATVTSPIGRA